MSGAVPGVQSAKAGESTRSTSGQGGATAFPGEAVEGPGSTIRPGITKEGSAKPRAKRVSATMTSQDGPAELLKEASAPASAVGATYRPTYEEISTRAYFIYIKRGSTPGDPMADWMQAERELIEARRTR